MPSDSSTWKVVVVEDHPLMRAAVVRSLSGEGAGVVGEATTAQEGYELIGQSRPDVAIVDIELEGESGVALARRLLGRDRHLGVIIYTGTDDVVALKDALDCGARGFVLKTSSPAVLRTAVHAVARGGSYVDNAVRDEIQALDTPGAERVLSVRQREVLQLASGGLTSEETAAELQLSVETVRTHVRDACRKLGASNRTHAVVIALRNGEFSL